MPETEKFNILKHKPLILLSALDWGLGHTTRCIPIIKTLLGLNCSVVVACNTSQKSLLKNEFPFLKFEDLKGYDIHYGAGKWQTILKIALQIPKMLTQIKHENRWLKRFVSANQIDAVISDNRYGFYCKAVPSIFISHQLFIKTGAL